MQWKEQALDRFSSKKDAQKWSNIYTAENPSVDLISFRQRRDFTVNYVCNHCANGSTILDLGCGAGPVLSQLCQNEYKLVGVDYSNDMLSLARQQLGEHAARVPLMQGECEAIPLPSESVDCIVCLGVISYAESITAALQEMRRVLRPDGIAIISYRNALNDAFMDPAQWPKSIFRAIFKSSVPSKKVIGRSIPRAEVMEEIDSVGFQFIAEQQMGFGTLRFNKKVVSDGSLAIKVNRLLDKCLTSLRLNRLYRAMSDVHIVVLKN